MPRILIVEDEQAQREVLSTSLKKNGYIVIEAQDGVEGLKTALEIHPDLILLDIHMPQMDGMTLMHKLRENAWGKTVPIIILTNYDNTESQLQQIVADQPSYYLLKANSTLSTVVEKVQEILQSKKIGEVRAIYV